MEIDPIDSMLEQWSEERPYLDTASLGVVVRVMALSRTFARQAATALEPLGIEPFEYDVLATLRRQGVPFTLPATSLAEESGLSAGAMTNRVDRLEEQGLVTRRADKRDRRGVNVVLTGAGKRTIDEAILRRLEAAEASLQGIRAVERKRLADLLRKVLLTTTG